MKGLVLGSNGQLGKCLRDRLETSDHDVIYLSRQELDITDLERSRIKISSIAPDVVINASAYTDVDGAEGDHEGANSVNHVAVDNIAKVCNGIGAWFVHLSTDYVFDGASAIPYKENDKRCPKTTYGASKLEGELAIEASSCKYIIIRTSWVFSKYGNNFLKTMLLLASERDELRVVSDQLGCPTYAPDIANFIAVLLMKLSGNEDVQGVYHFCGNRPCSWHEFAEVIFQEVKLLGRRYPRSIMAVRTIDFPTAAARPAYSVLDCSKAENQFGIKASDWLAGVRETVQKLV